MIIQNEKALEAKKSAQLKSAAKDVADAMFEAGFKTTGSLFRKHAKIEDDMAAFSAAGFTKNNYDVVDAQFATGGAGINVGDQTGMFDSMIMQIASTLTEEFSLSEYFPDEMLPAVDKIWVDVVDGIIGVAQDYTYGNEVNEVAKLGNQVYEFVAPAVRDKILFNETDILLRRELGNPNISSRGILQRVSLNSLNLYGRMLNKKKLMISQMVFNGSITYTPTMGASITVNSGALANQTATPTVAPWLTLNSTTQTYMMNTNANPIADILYWFSTYPQFIRLQPYIRKMIMNPITANAFISNPNTQAYISRVVTNQAIFDRNAKMDIGLAVKYFLPIFDIEVVVDSTSYMTAQVYNNGVANYFIPTGSIFFGVDTTAYGAPLGDFAFIGAIQNGGINDPQPGMFIVMEDFTAPGTNGGMEQPYLKLVSGFNGGVRVRRPYDILTAKVI
jgi:hypothetical protein